MVTHDKKITSPFRSTATDALAPENKARVRDLSAYHQLTDKQLWTAFKNDDEKAFVFIYRTYFASLYRYGSQFTTHTALIEDAIQDLFIEINQNKSRLSDTTSIKLYLFKSLKRKILYYISKAKKQVELSKGFDFGMVASVEQYLLDQQFGREQRDRLLKALQKLKPRQREIIYYYFYEGMDYEEIQ